MLPMYKICEEANGIGDRRYTVKYINTWLWPFWQTTFFIASTDVLVPIYYDTYEEALSTVESLKRNDASYNYKRVKCTIIK